MDLFDPVLGPIQMLNHFIILLLMFTTAIGYSQASATATTSVTIVKPISITKAEDMDFAEIAVSETNGTVILAPDGSRTVTGGAAFPSRSNLSPQAASFSVKGESYAYTVSVPSEIILTDGNNQMTVNNFTHDSSGTISDGGETLNIGATLHVNGKQTPGNYQNISDLKVTVNYN